MLEIVRWLPELAAETDLRKKEWEVVQGISRKLENRYETAARAGAISPDESRSIEELIEALNPLIYVSSAVGVSATAQAPH
ncbi:MAG: hypothetical protein U0903_11155 [Planctomycetales bacterium]